MSEATQKTCQFKSKRDPDYKCPEPPLEDSEKRYCVFHEPRRDKDIEKFNEGINRKLDKIDYDFRGYWFPPGTSRFELLTFKGAVDFENATFEGEANFRSSTFESYANFIGATFHQEADFPRTTFAGWGYFSSCIFEKKANFIDAIFKKFALFIMTSFKNEALFFSAKFNEASFTAATFG